MRRVHTLGWRRTRRYDEPSNDLGPLSPRQSCPAYIIDTRGYDSREGHHYWVRWSTVGKWQRVPDEVIIHGPNRVGLPVVWWHYDDRGVRIRCFVPGGKT
jgi:hypothetical protein